MLPAAAWGTMEPVLWLGCVTDIKNIYLLVHRRRFRPVELASETWRRDFSTQGIPNLAFLRPEIIHRQCSTHVGKQPKLLLLPQIHQGASYTDPCNGSTDIATMITKPKAETATPNEFG
jgi:hypothetical protein